MPIISFLRPAAFRPSPRPVRGAKRRAAAGMMKRGGSRPLNDLPQKCLGFPQPLEQRCGQRGSLDFQTGGG